MRKKIFQILFVSFFVLALALALAATFKVLLKGNPLIFLVALLTIILIGSFFLGRYLFVRVEKQINRKTILSERDVVASYNVIKKDIERMSKIINNGKIKEGNINELRVRLKRVEDNIDELEKYIIKGIKEIYIKNQY